MSENGHPPVRPPTWEDKLLQIHNDLVQRLDKLEEALDRE